MKTLTDLIHILMCELPHVYDPVQVINRKPRKCYYYIENDMADTENQPDHIYWNEVTENFRVSMGFKSPEEALEFVKECMRIVQQVNSITEGDEKKIKFLMALLT